MQGMKYLPIVAASAAQMSRIIEPFSDSVFPELFQISYNWVFDSGASRHFCRMKKVEKWLALARKVKGIQMATVDGTIDAKEVILMSMSRLSHMLTEIVLLPDTPI